MNDNLNDLLDQVRSPRDLRRLLDIPGLDDAVIDQFIGGVGADVMLGRIFELMAARFQPGRLRSGVVQWNITTSAGRYQYQLHLSREGATVRKGVPAKPRVTLAMSTPTLLQLCSGRLNPLSAVRAQKLKVRGNLLFGALMGRWFDY